MKRELPSQLAVVGLGYVDLQLATAFGRHLPTLGFDTDSGRIRELQAGHDRNGEVPQEALRAPHLKYTDQPEALRAADFIVVAVPTPVDKAKRPDLSYLVRASQLVGENLSPGATVVYESTVYPGCTEEVCIPVLEQASGLKAGRDFKVGYSPERINPGDPEYTLERVVKVVAGQDPETTERLARVYGLVVKASVYKAPDIRTAKAAKVIENVQRDLNIALMNELALLFHRLGLDTQEVLKAARTKWNFLPFEPGLVGGHCIPVDPYYLTYKAQEVGYHPELILAGRRINDGMGIYVARETIRLLIQAGKAVRGAKVLVYDPLVNAAGLQRLGLKGVTDPFVRESRRYDAIVLAVPHRAFRERPLQAYIKLLKDSSSGVLVDVKSVLREAVRETMVLSWHL